MFDLATLSHNVTQAPHLGRNDKTLQKTYISAELSISFLPDKIDGQPSTAQPQPQTQPTDTHERIATPHTRRLQHNSLRDSIKSFSFGSPHNQSRSCHRTHHPQTTFYVHRRPDLRFSDGLSGHPSLYNVNTNKGLGPPTRDRTGTPVRTHNVLTKAIAFAG